MYLYLYLVAHYPHLASHLGELALQLPQGIAGLFVGTEVAYPQPPEGRGEGHIGVQLGEGLPDEPLLVEGIVLGGAVVVVGEVLEGVGLIEPAFGERLPEADVGLVGVERAVGV